MSSAENRYDECCIFYGLAVCHYAECYILYCCYASVILLCVVLQYITLLSVILLSYTEYCSAECRNGECHIFC